ncbi:MAG: hypothetical protein L0Y54_00605 [Sporichthyaceae bacterium]|nr:hypothetical protein [Sporichthyaceae bacterium]
MTTTKRRTTTARKTASASPAARTAATRRATTPRPGIEAAAESIYRTGLLSRDAILAANDIRTVDVAVPEWSGAVRLRTLTGAERDAFETASVRTSGKHVHTNLVNLRARLVAACAVDEHGARLFSEADVKALGAKSSAALDRLFDAARKLSRIGEDDVAELTADFTPAQDGGSTSG